MNRLVSQRYFFIGLLSLVVLGAGCQFPTSKTFDPHVPPIVLPDNALTAVLMTNTLNPALLHPPTEPFTLGPGDKLSIEILGDPTSKAEVVVGPDGKIYYNLLPGLDVWGKTLDQAREAIESGLGQYLRQPPSIDITLAGVTSKKIWLLGRFETPGVYPLTNSTTLLEAIYEAGGPEKMANPRDYANIGANESLADLQHSFVLRNGHLLPVDFTALFRGDLSQNIYLQPDDYIYMPPLTADEVHVIGAVVSPRTVPFARQLTLLQALDYCSGTLPYAHLRQVAIVRGSLRDAHIALVDFRQIMDGKQPDIFLAPGDIVYVPFTPWRILAKYLDMAATTFVSSLAINEGSYAVFPNLPQPAGVFIPAGAGIRITGAGSGASAPAGSTSTGAVAQP